MKFELRHALYLWIAGKVLWLIYRWANYGFMDFLISFAAVLIFNACIMAFFIVMTRPPGHDDGYPP